MKAGISARWLSARSLGAGCLGLGLLLAACGGSERTVTTDDGTATIRSSDSGETTTATITGDRGNGTVVAGSGAKWPDDMPGWAPAYPGATVEAVFSGSDASSSSSVTSFTTSDAPDKVIAFYKERAAGAGLNQVSEMTTNDSRVLIASGEDGNGISITAGPEEGRTRASLTVSRKTG